MPDYQLTVSELEPLPRGRYRVVISDGETVQSEHIVTVDADFAAAFSESAARLVERSLSWLVTKEPPSAILGRFDLRDISSYFPEYPDVLGVTIAD